MEAAQMNGRLIVSFSEISERLDELREKIGPNKWFRNRAAREALGINEAHGASVMMGRALASCVWIKTKRSCGETLYVISD